MKLKKLVALITAGALCLGMSLTAFAADGSREKVPGTYDGVANDGDLAAVNKYLTEEQREQLADNAMDWLKENYPNIGKNAEIIAVGDYQLVDSKNGELITDGKVPGGKTLFTFALDANVDTTGFKKGATAYALHWNGKGYDIIEGTMTKDAYGNWVIQAEMDKFSPIAFIKVMSDGSIVEVDWKGDVVNPTKTVTKKASPKTGE